jgi:alkyldihydroxyacetonephosphate synthase
VSFEIDRTSLLVRVPGAATLASIETALAKGGLTLACARVSAMDTTVADWLASGAPGAKSGFADPADHLVAGLTATLTNGRRIDVRPAPRRAVGPDLVTLFVGANERFGTIDHVWLRVVRKDARDVELPIDGLDLDPPLSDDEASLLDAIARELAG